MSTELKERVSAWLEEAGASMGGDPRRRRDILLELETTIYDRVEERTGAGEPEEEALQEVLRSLGDAASVAGGYLPERALVAPHHTRAFLANTLALFAAHFLLAIGATVAGRSIGVSFLSIDPILDPRNLLAVFSRAMQTLLVDAGAMLVLFAFLPRVTAALRFPSASLAVKPNVRRCVEGAFFLALVAVVVNFLRDDLLALYLPREGGATQVPLVGPGLRENLLFFNLWIGLSFARDLLYARLGERRGTLALDIVATMAGLFCLLRIVAAERLVDLTAADDALGPAAVDSLSALLNTAFSLLAMAAAALLAARLVRRSLRLRGREAGRDYGRSLA